MKSIKIIMIGAVLTYLLPTAISGQAGQRKICATAADCRVACDHGDWDSCVSLVNIFEQGIGVPMNVAFAVRLYNAACRNGLKRGCLSMADLNRRFAEGCTAGEAPGCYNLGVAYDKGLGLHRNYEKAFDLFRRACVAGFTPGCVNLGVAYNYGKGVALNYGEASRLYSLACNAGNLGACAALGMMYFNGEGRPKYFNLAFKLFKKACDAGDASGCSGLGLAFREGKGVTADHDQARTLFLRACESQWASGCFNLGVFCMEREPKDVNEGAKYFEVACNLDHAALNLWCQAFSRIEARPGRGRGRW
ncbi:MAG: sel1 repeat family protein [Proteobacteria bacterium]|nr:sel1 repeat family protein [Pseudomonadota bacterium]